MSDANFPEEEPKKLMNHSDYVLKAEQSLLDQKDKNEKDPSLGVNPLLPIPEDWTDMQKENLEEDRRRLAYEKGVKSIQGDIDK